MSTPDIDFLAELEAIINARLESASEQSYTAQLAKAGTKRMAQKVGEEGVELALAAAAGDRDELIDEAADLIYHVVVLLASEGLGLGDVSQRLESRHNS